MSRTIPSNLIISCAVATIGLAACGPARAEEPRHKINRGESVANPAGKAAASSAGLWLSTGGVGVALAAFGVYSLAAKKVRPAGDSPSLRVIGRASLSARQSVYLVKVGDRTLIVGAGAQGPPSLLGELAETPSIAPHIAPISRIGGAA